MLRTTNNRGSKLMKVDGVAIAITSGGICLAQNRESPS
jgi:hypothetical protein